MTRKNSRWVLLVLVVAASGLSICCSDDSAPPIPQPDTGPTDGGPTDGGPTDGQIDTGLADTLIDTPARDGTLDTMVPEDTLPPPTDSRPSVDPCEGVTPTVCESPCPAGTACAPDTCGSMACVPGRPCSTSEECGAAECSIPEGATRGTCAPNPGDCTTSASCPAGAFCEGGSCVNRRIRCGSVLDGCPRGYVCGFEPGMGVSMFCTIAHVRCVSDAQCELGYSCGDVDEDGMTECRPSSGPCLTNSDCSGDQLCSILSGSSVPMCAPDGACGGATTCPTGRTCTDITNGEGAPRCEIAGSCASNTDCPAGQLCAAGGLGDALRCIGGPDA